MIGDSTNKRDIIINKRDSTIQRINETHPSYDCLQYPLIFWKGQSGYGINLKQSNGKKMSCMNYYAYLIMVRENDYNVILHFRELYHQYATDMYAKVEGERLAFIRFNQEQLRTDNYDNVKDAMNNDGEAHNLGQIVILPSSYTGSPRYMRERQQDAMAYVRRFGKPDLFITFTCNPEWKEIKENIFNNQKVIHRHDITARVFRQYVLKLVDLMKNANIFGKQICYMYTIEWQKRGLPHAHLLSWLQESIKPTQVDSIISADIPNIEDEQLYNTVKNNMIHGPCGYLNIKSPCMSNGKCSKNFPKNFIGETQTDRDGYPLYRRRDANNGGKIVTKMIHGKEIQIDNRWVVPYCPLLSKIFNAHINVEMCNSVKSIKYICKYIHKGSDMAIVELEETDKCDEIKRYQMARYISSNEAIWRILDFQIHQRYPAIIQLVIHLENGQRIYFTESNVRERINIPPKTMLTSFFDLCGIDNFAKTLLYQDIPQYYTWQVGNRIWKRRLQGDRISEGIFKSSTIGRIYTVHPKNLECFYLRLLLTTVKGPVSFEDIRTVNGVICNTYKKACAMLDLLEDDEHWDNTLKEASISRSPRKIRELFAMMICHCEITDIPSLWLNNRECMSEDILLEYRRHNTEEVIEYNEEIFLGSLARVQGIVKRMGGDSLQKYGFVNIEMVSSIPNEHNYDRILQIDENKLNYEQRLVYNNILQSVINEEGKLFFLDAPAGTGKTFLINLLLAKNKMSGTEQLAVASSGIAATLLLNGRTAHSTFKIPIKINENSICSITRNSKEAEQFRNCKFIVWDECTMAHKYALEAVDRMLRDIVNYRKPMGGITLLLSGDFRQILPVVRRGTKADHINACLKTSILWKYIDKLTLKKNMRVYLSKNRDTGSFEQNLLDIGNGVLKTYENMDIIPCGIIVKNHNELISKIYEHLLEKYSDEDWLCERCILAPKNNNVCNINKRLLNLFPGDPKLYMSIDRVVKEDEVVDYPIEFLNSINLPGLPDHMIELKVGVPIILLRNLDPPRLCNGSRLLVTNLKNHIIEARILTGEYKGEQVMIPKIPLIPSDYPFNFKRLQFPIRLCFSMTINKSQGQSFKVVGLDLETECFSHGQLYVGCSRARDENQLYILANNGMTRNVVYKEVL